MASRTFVLALGALLLGALLVGAPLVPRPLRAATGDSDEERPRPIPINAAWDVLPPARELTDVPAGLEAAAAALGDWRIYLADVPLDGPALHSLAERARSEPVVRALREQLQRTVDPLDLLRFLDDVLAAGRAGRRSEPFYVTPGRARDTGIFIHPEEVFEGRTRDYPAGRSELAVDRPLPPNRFRPARDGELLGPRWTSRFPNPEEESTRMELLEARRPDYAARIASLMEQLREQGAQVELNSTLRPRERGYLMWGAFVLSRAGSSGELRDSLRLITQRNREWRLNVPIRWRRPGNWRATQTSAREMADVYDVVFATEDGARNSNHYTGVAVDVVAVGLPRTLRLRAPNGRGERTFDLSGVDETRDLSLTPALIAWIEEQFDMRKLRSDYPHWEDARLP